MYDLTGTQYGAKAAAQDIRTLPAPSTFYKYYKISKEARHKPNRFNVIGYMCKKFGAAVFRSGAGQIHNNSFAHTDCDNMQLANDDLEQSEIKRHNMMRRQPSV